MLLGFPSLGFAPVANAATVTDASDLMSDQTAGEASNHTITFTTPSGAAEGETITVSFASSFNTALIDEDDVDVSDDGLDLTTAANCAAAEQASVAIAADILTITICAGDGGAIAAGSEVVIEIGDQAAASGVGAEQVTNPGSAGTYFITIGGTFGDFGTIALPIIDDSAIGVTATVGDVGGDGGGDPGGEGASSAPAISNVACSASDTTLSITWNTNIAADSSVDYGLTSSYASGTETDATLDTSHEIVLAGLSSGTTYHYRVRSTDAEGDEEFGSDETCTTDTSTALAISDVAVMDETTSSATVTFDTNEEATCSIEYGLTESYGSVTGSSSGTSHTVTISGLDSGTEYQFNIVCDGDDGDAAESGNASFTTTEDTPPANATGFSCTAADAAIDFDWTMPSEDDLAGSMITCSTSGYPQDESEGTTHFSGSASTQSTTVSGLTNSTTYFCTHFVFDDGGNYSSGTTKACTPQATDVPPTDEEEVPEDEIPGGETEETPDGETTTETPGGETPDDEETASEEITPPATGTGTTSSATEFYSAEDTILLSADEGMVDVIPSTIFSIFIPADAISGVDVASVTVTLNGDTYIVSLESSGDGYRAYIQAPDDSGSYNLTLTFLYTDGTGQVFDYTLNVVDLGYVYEVYEGAVMRVPGAIVSLMQSQFGTWELMDVYQFGGQSNPDATSSDGTYAWYVENGTYRVEVSKSGYEDATSSTFVVSNNIATLTVEISRVPMTIPEIIAEGEPSLETAVAVADAVISAIKTIFDDLRNIPEIQVATDIAVPAAIVIGIASVGLLWSLFGLAPLLQYVMTWPVLFLWRKKRKAWGVVYHAGLKTPIDLAIVRLYKLPENKLVMTRVTDKEGRFFFLVKEGDYRIIALKPGFVFPSQILNGAKEDGNYLDVYHGESIRVESNDATIAVNIPLDPTKKAEYHEARKLVIRRILRLLQNTIAAIGCTLAFFIFIIRPGWITAAGAIIQVLLLLGTRRLAKAHKPKGWGIVYDKGTAQPLSNAVVRIFEPKYNKLLETAITDAKGRYSFLVGPSQYFTTYEKPGYQKVEIRPIDTTTSKEPGEIAIDVELDAAPKPEKS